MPRVATGMPMWRQLQLFNVSQKLVIQPGLILPHLNKGLLAPQLMDANCRLDVAEVVFESALNHLIVPIAFFGVTVPSVLADTVQAKNAHPLQKGFLVGRHHPTFTRCEVLCSVKTESNYVAATSFGRNPSANRHSLVLGSYGMSRVFNDAKVVTLSQLPDRIHLARKSTDVN